MPITRDVTAPQARRVLLLGFPSSLGGVCLQPSHRLALRYRHGASAAGKAERHPSLSCCDQRQLLIFAPGMPLEPGQTQAMGCPLHTTEAPASLRGFPAWQRSQHPSPTHGPSWRELRVPVWGGTFPFPPALPSTQHLCHPLVHPRVPWSSHAVCRRRFHPVISGAVSAASLPLATKLNIMWQHRCDCATVGQEECHGLGSRTHHDCARA